MTNATRVGAIFTLSGLGLLALAFWGLWRDIGWIAQPFYAFAWWGYILGVDGLCSLRRGDSLLTSRRRFLVPMAIWSVTFWFFFEFLNLRFQNWYYVGVQRVESFGDLLFGGFFVVACFSTVFVGIFETCDLLASWRVFDRPLSKTRQAESARPFPVWVSYAVQGLGVTMAGLAICFPYYLAPLIWGSFTFLVDPWNYRRGARSLLRDVEMRHWGLIARIFLAGLICGFVWESFNFFAPQKWIYTVRGLEGFKLFEMPLLGFLGFPGLAYDALAGFALLASLFLGNQTWELPSDLRYTLRPRPVAPRWIFWGSVPVQVAFWGLICSLAIGVSFGSLELRLRDLSLAPLEIDRLAELGIDRPRQLLAALRDVPEDGVETPSPGVHRLGWDEDRRRELRDEVELFTFKGIGSRYGAALRRLGIETVDELRAREPHELHRRIWDELGEAGPRLDMVKVWVLASRDRGVVMDATAASLNTSPSD